MYGGARVTELETEKMALSKKIFGQAVLPGNLIVRQLPASLKLGSKVDTGKWLLQPLLRNLPKA